MALGGKMEIVVHPYGFGVGRPVVYLDIKLLPNYVNPHTVVKKLHPNPVLRGPHERHRLF